MDIAQLKKINGYCWTLRESAGVSSPIQLYGSESLIREMDDKVLEQISNVAQLPGLVNAAMTMPDAHWGYGFPIGGVAAFDPDREELFQRAAWVSIFPVASVVYVPIWFGMSLKGFVKQWLTNSTIAFPLALAWEGL